MENLYDYILYSFTYVIILYALILMKKEIRVYINIAF